MLAAPRLRLCPTRPSRLAAPQLKTLSLLVLGDPAPAGGRAERVVRTESADDAGRCSGGDAARAGQARRADRARGTFPLRHVVTEVGVDPKVSAIVYVAARAPDAGENYAALAKMYPTPPASAGIVFDGDEGRLTEAAFLRDFAGDLPEAQTKVLYAVQQPFHKALLTGRTKHAAWRSKRSFYAVSTEDRTINPELERFMAKRIEATTIELKSSHVSLVSHPKETADLILEAAGRG